MPLLVGDLPLNSCRCGDAQQLADLSLQLAFLSILPIPSCRR
jgi:hypothetical protein